MLIRDSLELVSERGLEHWNGSCPPLAITLQFSERKYDKPLPSRGTTWIVDKGLCLEHREDGDMEASAPTARRHPRSKGATALPLFPDLNH